MLEFPPYPVSVSQLVQTQTSIPRTAASNAAAGFPYWQIGVLGALTLWLYWATITHLVAQWWGDPNFSHGFFVPLFSGFVLWQERDRFLRLTPAPNWSGLAIISFALVLLIIGQLGAELFLARFSLLILLAGAVILFFGWNFLRAALFPWAFLLLMIPIPAIVFNQITFPLQILASKVAAAALPLFGVPILREGNVINLPAMALEVAEACSGIRSLMSLVTLAIIYGYLAERRLWVRWVLALASVGVSVLLAAIVSSVLTCCADSIRRRPSRRMRSLSSVRCAAIVRATTGSRVPKLIAIGARPLSPVFLISRRRHQ